MAVYGFQRYIDTYSSPRPKYTQIRPNRLNLPLRVKTNDVNHVQRNRAVDNNLQFRRDRIAILIQTKRRDFDAVCRLKISFCFRECRSLSPHQYFPVTQDDVVGKHRGDCDVVFSCVAL